MSSASSRPIKEYRRPPGIPFRQSPATAAIIAINSSVETQSSRCCPADGGSAYGSAPVSDDDLITAAQNGDQHAVVELFRRYSPLAKKKIMGIVRNQEDAEDALQDTLLRAYTHLSTFRRSCRFSTWITTIGMNSALMILRKRKIRREAYAPAGIPDTGASEEWEHVDPSAGPEESLLKQQVILLVRREVKKLRPGLRSIVEHYYTSEGSLEELAKALNISVAAAKSRLLRGRIRLRSRLARYGVSGCGS